jgi:glutamate racemase
MKIGVFDSGIGGKSVQYAIQQKFPELTVIFENDSENMPYGNKNADQLFDLTKPHIDNLIGNGCEIIVVACNTISTNILDRLQSTTSVVLIGVEPMVEEAAKLTKSGVITVFATPATLRSAKYNQMTINHGQDVKVIEPDCSKWSYLIETKKIDLDSIKHQVKQSNDSGSDVIVLGCTHYHWIEDIIQRCARDGVAIIQPEEKVLQHLAK